MTLAARGEGEHYHLRVPLAKDHWIAVSSNKPLTIEHFRRLHQHLALQREMLTEDHPTGDDR